MAKLPDLGSDALSSRLMELGHCFGTADLVHEEDALARLRLRLAR